MIYSSINFDYLYIKRKYMEPAMKLGNIIPTTIRESMSRGEIRKIADDLLGKLSAAYLRNIAWDNRPEIKKILDDIANSTIEWDTDVINSVKHEYTRLTSSDVINQHLTRSGDSFSK